MRQQTTNGAFQTSLSSLSRHPITRTKRISYLVPDVIKKTWGGAPGVAILATNAGGSEYAAKILHESGLRVRG
jgi:hypothetical protein